MKAGRQFWWFALISIALTGVILLVMGVLFWRQLTPEEQSVLFSILKDDFGYLFAAVFLIMAGIGFALDGIFHVYILPVIKLKEEVRIINSANPAHRIAIDGNRDLQELVATINAYADRYQLLREDVNGQIDAAKAEAETEKNILAAFMAELPEGVIVCNLDGRILLYNRQAKSFLAGQGRALENGSELGTGSGGQFIGLGRSIFGLIDRHMILHVLDEMSERLSRGEEIGVGSAFALVGEFDRFLRVEVVPVLDPSRQLTGFILILFDITRRLESENRMNLMLQTLIRRGRASLASIRSAIEAILDFPEMTGDQRRRFQQIIHDESVRLGRELDHTAAEMPDHFGTRWPLIRMDAETFLKTVQKKLAGNRTIDFQLQFCEAQTGLKADTYSLHLAILFLLEQIGSATGQTRVDCELRRYDRLLHLDLIWDGAPIKPDLLRQWEADTVSVGAEKLPLSLGSVIRHHDGELWSHASRRWPGKACLRLVLPAVDPAKTRRKPTITILPESRPVFYDFDLFHQPGQSPELESVLLRDLTYTVFDTETTGLNPAGGDEIISIGAVRIVNNRLLPDEVFDQLVDPGCPVPAASVKIHGISQDMLDGQPKIDRVLPAFHRFAEGTILVAHNAAFDMRMLQLKEHASGVRFINPVLDTMLLSAVVHPAQDGHNLEDIAKRLGIRIIGRHTALGDAMTTGDIFLKLIPLLTHQEIHTLKHALSASEKTYLARKRY